MWENGKLIPTVESQQINTEGTMEVENHHRTTSRVGRLSCK